MKAHRQVAKSLTKSPEVDYASKDQKEKQDITPTKEAFAEIIKQ